MSGDDAHKHWFFEMVESNSLGSFCELIRGEAERDCESRPWNTMLYLAAHYMKQHPEDAEYMEAFADWRSGMYSADELMQKAFAEIETQQRATDEAARVKKELARGKNEQRQRLAEEIWNRSPNLTKKAVAEAIHKKHPELGSAGHIRGLIKKLQESAG